MARLREPIILSWSGGKDSVLALWDMKKSGRYDVTALLTVVSEHDDRVKAHGVARGVLEEQARALGIPLVGLGEPVISETARYRVQRYGNR